MIEAMIELADPSKTEMATFFFVFLRIGAAIALMPVFGEQTIPLRVRLALALAFTAIVFPISGMNFINDGSSIWMLGAAEVVNGLALGVGFRLLVFSLQIAGSIIAQSTSLSQILGSAQAEPTPAIGQLFLVSGLAIAAILGLHVRVTHAFVFSYEMLPGGNFPSPSEITQWGVANVARAFSLAFSLAAPFVIASFIYNVALGVINRAMPQLMVAMVGAPAITLGSLALMLVVAPFIISIWWNAFELYLANPFDAH
ncbi:flagellar biosynthetic protein FliR [Falsihalocynthiibacter sp. SS001]|uniref:flagellar biosynthetic protein FliR n=1 Tax=Falsihalocynthiibacter sp. SS001 TaxID=3349698 RepID=UPI0036D26EE2